MPSSFNKKEREKKRRKKKQDKIEKMKQRKLEGKTSAEFMYMDEDGILRSTPPEPTKKKEIKLEEIQISIPKLSEREQEETERKGIVKFFNEEKRFGFISEKEGQQDYFVHEDNLIDEIKDKDKVLFEIGTGPKGLIAVNVRLLT